MNDLWIFLASAAAVAVVVAVVVAGGIEIAVRKARTEAAGAREGR